MQSSQFLMTRRVLLLIAAPILLTAVVTGWFSGAGATGPSLSPDTASETAGVQATPFPSVDLKVEGMEFPDQALIGEVFCYTARIENYGDVAGYGPAIVIALPEGMTLESASLPGVSGSSMGTPASVFPINFQGPFPTDPLSQQPPLSGNYGYYIIPAPIGSLFAGTTGIDLKLCVKVDVNMPPDVPVPVCHSPYFQFGDSASGATPIKGERVCSDLTPVLVRLSKKILAPTSNKKAPLPTNEVVTGCTAYTFQLCADIARDVFLLDLNFTDILPDELIFVPGSVVVKGASAPPLQITDNTNPGGGGALSVLINDDTGMSGPDPDLIIEFKAFVKNFLDKNSCETREIANVVKLDAFNADGEPVKQQTALLPIEVEHVAIQKSAAGPHADPLFVNPGDTVSYRLDFQVSQDISANISIEDVLPDGILFDFGSAVLSCASGFNGPITPGVILGKQNGKTFLTFNIGQSPGCTSCSISYTAKVSQAYTHSPPGDPVRASDLLVNTAKVNYSIDGGAGGCEEETLGAVLVNPVTISKTIKNPKDEYIPGDLVRFSLKMTIPSGDTQNITFIDFLPLPIFEVTGIQPFNIQLGPNHNVGGTFTVDRIPGQNAVMFTFNDVTTTGNPVPCIEIEFSVQVTTNPFADDLYLTNLFQAFTTNTKGEVQTQLTGVSLHVRAPKLRITKGVFSADNPNAVISPAPDMNQPNPPVDGNVAGVDGGDKIVFYITVKNEGGAPAYSVEINDVLPPELMFVSASPAPNVGPPPTFTVSGQSITVKYAKFPSLLPGETSVFSITAMLPPNIEACRTITNTASVKWRNVYDPEVIGPPLPPFFPAATDNASVTTAGPRITKTVPLTSHEPTAGNDVTIGEIITYKVEITFPQGVSSGVTVMDGPAAGLVIQTPPPPPPTITATASSALALSNGGSLTSALIAGNKLNFNFGTVTNTDSDNSTPETISFTYNVIVLNVAGNANGVMAENKVTVTTANCSVEYVLPVRIVEPKLEIAKEFVPATAAAGDPVEIRLRVTNTGLSDAYDVVIEDLLDSAFGGINQVITPAGYGFSLNGQIVTYSTGAGVSIKPGETVTLVFRVLSRICGQFPNQARITRATTLPGTAPLERDQPDVGSATVTLTVDGNCPCVDPPRFSNMVGWWPLDESTGTTVINDLTGLNPGIPKGLPGQITYSPPAGKVNGAIRFSNGFIEVFDSPSLDIGTSDLTIDAWVELPQNPAFQPIVDKFDTVSNKGYLLAIDQNGILQFKIGDGAKIETYQSTSPLLPPSQQPIWQHVAVTVSRNAGTPPVRFFIDGNDAGTVSVPVIPPGDIGNSRNLLLGGFVRIRLDEIEIFNAALTESEVKSIVTAGSTGKCKCPVVDLKAGKRLFNTGVDNNHQVMSPGVLDGHYKVIDQSNKSLIPYVLAPFTGLTTVPDAQWITIDATNGVFRFQVEFDLSGCELNSASISGNYAIAAPSGYIQVNNNPGQLFPSVNNYGNLQNFTIDSGLQPGKNTLTFVITIGERRPALLVQFTGATARCCACSPISLSPNSLPKGSQHYPYPSTSFTATGGVAPYTYAITGGALPLGMSLSAGGQLIGSPLTAGNFSISVTATDQKGCSVTRRYMLTIRKRIFTVSYETFKPDNLHGQAGSDPPGIIRQTNKLNVKINLEALGDEHAVNFSLGFDPALLSNPVVSPGRDAVGATVNTDTSEVAQGRLGVSVTLPGNQVFAEGSKEAAQIQFDFAGSNIGELTSLGFKDQPVQRSVTDVAGNQLSTEYPDSPVLLAPVVTSVSAANYAAEPLAPEQILAAFGTNLATATTVATELPLPATLAGTTVNVRDSSGTDRAAQLFFVSPNQVNYLMPAGLAPGQAVVTIRNSDGDISGGIVGIAEIAPGLFTVDATGKGIVSSNALTLKPDNTFTQQPTAMFDPNLNRFVSVPIDLGSGDDRVFLVLYGTGIRLRTSESNVRASIGGLDLPVLYAGPQGVFAGLDQINVELPRALAGLGEVDIILTVDGVVTNAARINIQ
ncbi:MAG: DUF11 domain-containing protein [Acidobacteriota bacterium]|nr:MAG: DUF11 domain-containing protein [Acidobacteriota bacterium]